MASDKMRIRVTVGHCLGGVGNDIAPGTVLVAPDEISIAEATRKVGIGYAVVLPNATEESEQEGERSESSQVITRDPAIKSRDPEIIAPEGARRGRSRTGGR